MTNEVPAQRTYAEMRFYDPWDEEAQRRLDAGEMVPRRTEDGRVEDARCVCGRRKAGAGTRHPGVGRCRDCGGATRSEDRIAGLMERHAFTRGTRITPANALLTQVHLAHSRIEFINERLGELLDRTITEDGRPDPDALIKDPDVRSWLTLQQAERDFLIKAAKLAYEAGADELRTDYGVLFIEAVKVFLGRIGITDPAQVTATLQEVAEICVRLEREGVGQLPPA